MQRTPDQTDRFGGQNHRGDGRYGRPTTGPGGTRIRPSGTRLRRHWPVKQGARLERMILSGRYCQIHTPRLDTPPLTEPPSAPAGLHRAFFRRTPDVNANPQGTRRAKTRRVAERFGGSTRPPRTRTQTCTAHGARRTHTLQTRRGLRRMHSPPVTPAVSRPSPTLEPNALSHRRRLASSVHRVSRNANSHWANWESLCPHQTRWPPDTAARP